MTPATGTAHRRGRSTLWLLPRASQTELLRAQFEEVRRISAQLDEVHGENRTLTAAIRDAKAQNENLQQRLDIGLRTNTELSEKLEREKKAFLAQGDDDHTRFQQAVHKTKRQAQAQIEAVGSQLQSLQDAKDQCDLEHRLTANKIERLLRNAKQYFNAKFADLGQTDVPVEAPKPDDPQKLDRKPRALSSRLKAANAAPYDLEKQLAKAQRDKAETENRYRDQIADIESRHQLETADRALTDSDRLHLVKTLETKAYKEELLAQNGQLKKELQELKAKCRDLQEEIEDYQNAAADGHRLAIEATDRTTG